MDPKMTPDQRAFARAAVQNGRFQREEDAIPEALALWERRERARVELLADLDAAEASIAAGKGRAITEQSMHDLAADVKQRGRARLAAAQRRRR
jgi:Arc/MetJ-type ribon-helix-helix transcriptional regulator